MQGGIPQNNQTGADLWLQSTLKLPSYSPSNPPSEQSIAELLGQQAIAGFTTGHELEFAWDFVDRPEVGTTVISFHSQPLRPPGNDGLRYLPAHPAETHTSSQLVIMLPQHPITSPHPVPTTVMLSCYTSTPAHLPPVTRGQPIANEERMMSRVRKRYHIMRGAGHPGLFFTLYTRTQNPVPLQDALWQTEPCRQYPLIKPNLPKDPVMVLGGRNRQGVMSQTVGSSSGGATPSSSGGPQPQSSMPNAFYGGGAPPPQSSNPQHLPPQPTMPLSGLNGQQQSKNAFLQHQQQALLIAQQQHLARQQAMAASSSSSHPTPHPPPISTHHAQQPPPASSSTSSSALPAAAASLHPSGSISDAALGDVLDLATPRQLAGNRFLRVQDALAAVFDPAGPQTTLDRGGMTELMWEKGGLVLRQGAGLGLLGKRDESIDSRRERLEGVKERLERECGEEEERWRRVKEGFGVAT